MEVAASQDTLEDRLEAIYKHRTSRVRMTLDLSFRLNEMIEELAQEKQTSKSDIIRFSVEFLAMAMGAKANGMAVGAWIERDGLRTEREFVGL